MATRLDTFDAEPTVAERNQPLAELMRTIGGHAQEPAVKRCNFFTELQDTQVLPAIEPEGE
jgi:hypothetical protein